MLFSSYIFLHIFLPVAILLGYVFRRFQNAILVLMSLLFYAWGGVSYTIVMLLSILLNYWIGRWIGSVDEQKKRKKALIAGVVVNLLVLMVFKYLFFIVSNINIVLENIGIGTIPVSPMRLPLGISFFTFQAMSYLIDVYRKQVEVQKKVMNLALYISFFPQLIAGPIVRYHDIARQLIDRKPTLLLFGQGVHRFIIGLAKKVLLANTFGFVADNIFAVPEFQLTTGGAWLGMVCYTFQIFFDFSGYSDMAIGLGKMFGFELPENFNFPYISKSIREFWRRWHITLSHWFRDYLYIPLGGNRKSSKRTLFNLLIVFGLCGLWHGASWNFVLWGLIHGFFMVLERGVWGKALDKLWKPLQHIYTILIVMFCWVLFRTETLFEFGYFVKALVGASSAVDTIDFFSMLWNFELWIYLIIGAIISTPVLSRVQLRLKGAKKNHALSLAIDFTYGISMCLLFAVAVTYVAAGSYNPFIYFRF